MAARSYNKTNGIIYFDDTLRAASRIAELTSEEAQQVFSDLITSFAISNESRMSKRSLCSFIDLRINARLASKEVGMGRLDDYVDRLLTPDFIEWFGVKEVYTFRDLNEVWVVVEGLTSDKLLRFNDITYFCEKNSQTKNIISLIIDKGSLEEDEIPPYDEKIEV
ncbi:MAG: hypothetical protein KH284_12535 [Clostridiales bacterium]|nr:hypothetical protein [Clostridiales bacterium]